MKLKSKYLGSVEPRDVKEYDDRKLREEVAAVRHGMATSDDVEKAVAGLAKADDVTALRAKIERLESCIERLEKAVAKADTEIARLARELAVKPKPPARWNFDVKRNRSGEIEAVEAIAENATSQRMHS